MAFRLTTLDTMSAEEVSLVADHWMDNQVVGILWADSWTAGSWTADTVFLVVADNLQGIKCRRILIIKLSN